ncbi:MAG: hypothetical protein CBB71_03590 [Rhodopirellula sp. TMED11]|nr:MAG: hypothetical protein CBB71_03590 [Rhodopirellula sp. TMED11]
MIAFQPSWPLQRETNRKLQSDPVSHQKTAGRCRLGQRSCRVKSIRWLNQFSDSGAVVRASTAPCVASKQCVQARIRCG